MDFLLFAILGIVSSMFVGWHIGAKSQDLWKDGKESLAVLLFVMWLIMIFVSPGFEKHRGTEITCDLSSSEVTIILDRSIPKEEFICP